MSTWNYRLMKRTYCTDWDEDEYEIVEAYYNGDGSVRAWTERGAVVGGATPEEARHNYELQAEAFTLPVLNEVELERERKGKR